MNKKDLIAALAEKAELPKTTVAGLLAHLDELLTEALVAGESVRLLGLGTLTQQERAPRTYRDPNTSQKKLLGSYITVRFRPSSGLKQRINGDREANWRDPRHQHARRTAATLIADLALYNPSAVPTLSSDADDAAVRETCARAFGDDWARSEETLAEKVDADVLAAFDYLAFCARSEWA